MKGYIADLFALYTQNPAAVDSNWQEFFAALSDDEAALLGDFNGPSWKSRATRIVGAISAEEAAEAAAKAKKAGKAGLDQEAAKRATQDSVSALSDRPIKPLTLRVEHQQRCARAPDAPFGPLRTSGPPATAPPGRARTCSS